MIVFLKAGSWVSTKPLSFQSQVHTIALIYYIKMLNVEEEKGKAYKVKAPYNL